MDIHGLSIASLLIAFVGGVISFISPCVLPLVPVYIGHLSGVSVREGAVASGRETFSHALCFVSGFLAVFVTLGATVGLLGGFAGGHQVVVSRIAGALLIVMGLYTAGAFRMPGVRRVLAPVTGVADSVHFRERRYQGHMGQGPGYWRSLGVGGAFAVGWIPCITPVLGAILTLAYSGSGAVSNAWTAAAEAGVLLTFYAAGMSIPFLAAGLALGRVTAFLKGLRGLMPVATVASGLLIMGVGVLVFFNLLPRLNHYFGFLPYVSF